MNAHPSDVALSNYGLNIIPLAAKLGVAGVKLVADHHFTLARLKSSHRQHLLWSNVPYSISVIPKPTGKLAITLNKPKGKITFRWPDLNELRRCFYSLLSIAIVGHWKDHSKFTPDQIRFLIRLSGLKLTNANQLSNDLIGLFKPLSQGALTAQEACQQMPKLFAVSNRGKLITIINFLKEEALNNPQSQQPVLIAKSIYIHQVLNHLAPAKRNGIINRPSFRDFDRIPANDYVTMDKNYRWHRLSNQDVINFINALIFYLK